MSSRILLTRPAPYAQATQQALEQEGHTVIPCPLVVLKPLNHADWHLPEHSMIIFVSRMSVDILAPQHQAPEGVQVAAVGPGTAQALKEQGWRVDHQPHQGMGAKDLMASLPQDLSEHKVWIPCGNRHHPWLDEALRARGAQVVTTVIYHLEPHPQREAYLDAALAQQPDSVLLTSPWIESLWHELAASRPQAQALEVIKRFYRSTDAR